MNKMRHQLLVTILILAFLSLKAFSQSSICGQKDVSKLFKYSDFIFKGKLIEKIDTFQIKGNLYEFIPLYAVNAMRLTFIIEQEYKGNAMQDTIYVYQLDDNIIGRQFTINSSYNVYCKIRNDFQLNKENYPIKYKKFLYTDKCLQSILILKEESLLLRDLSKQGNRNRKIKCGNISSLTPL
ncbi:MAG: hypothetical protein PF481_09835 [Bacteroidales bacterium]|jgi:hypothetical protein|nr:hypothetical protein [Bacteroidales bacterium]